MSNFADRIKSKLPRPSEETGREGPANGEFERVLDEFAETLNREWPSVHASVVQEPMRHMRTLVTRPKLRRDERSLMLTFSFDRDAVRVVNEPTQRLASPEALRDFLLSFLESPGFQATLAAYAHRAAEDIDGFLRTDKFNVLTRDDVLVIVARADQERLATAQPATALTLDVKPEEHPATGRYGTTRRYTVLASAGFGLRIARHSLTAEGLIRLEGTVLAEDELLTA